MCTMRRKTWPAVHENNSQLALWHTSLADECQYVLDRSMDFIGWKRYYYPYAWDNDTCRSKRNDRYQHSISLAQVFKLPSRSRQSVRTTECNWAPTKEPFCRLVDEHKSIVGSQKSPNDRTELGVVAIEVKQLPVSERSTTIWNKTYLTNRHPVPLEATIIWLAMQSPRSESHESQCRL